MERNNRIMTGGAIMITPLLIWGATQLVSVQTVVSKQGERIATVEQRATDIKEKLEKIDEKMDRLIDAVIKIKSVK